MKELSNEAKELLIKGKHYLEDNDVNGFYNYLDRNLCGGYMPEITQWLLDHDIDLLSKCRNKIVPYMFWGADITDAHIPESVEIIGEYAFDGCKNLEQVYIPVSVHTIKNYAFDRCDKLSEVYLPSSVQCIGVDAFPKTTILKCDFWPEDIDWVDWENYTIVGWN